MSASYPELRVTRCVRYRYAYSDCTRCIDACPHDALEAADDGVRIDAMRCRNCALCAGACRTEAWHSAKLARVDTLKRAIGQPRFSWACAPSGESADAIVPCLGALGAPTLAFLAKRGIAVELRGTEHCETCAHAGKGKCSLDASLHAVEALRVSSAEQWAGISLPHGGNASPKSTPNPARRQLFRRLVGRGIDEARAAARSEVREPVPARAIRAGAPFRAEQRELLQLIGKRRDDAPFPVEAHESLPLMDLRATAACTSCEACFRACPTGALRIDETDFSWSLAFDADRCPGCGACIEVCQPRALRPQAQVDVRPSGELRPLAARAKQRCGRCDRFFVSKETSETCPVCRDDEKAFSAILG